MYSKKNNSGKAMSMTGGLASGCTVSLLITLAGAVILSKLLEYERLEWDKIGYGIVIVFFIASFSGTATAIAKIKRRKFVITLASFAIYFTVLLITTGLFFGGQYEAVDVTAGLLLSGSICAFLLNASKNPRKHSMKNGIYR